MSGNLIDYRVEKGVAIFELNDPPANTYTYEMNRELDDCILKARMDDDVHVIVMMNGHTVGGGLEIAMAADIRIALKGAGKVGLPEVTLGVLPGTGGTQRLSRLVGKSRAIQIMSEGNLFDFEQAQEWGIINYVWPAEEGGRKWWDRVMEYAWGFCPPNKAARAVGRIKRAVQTGWEIPLESALAVERELQQQLFQSDDAKEGLGAYNAKRKPQFAGK